MEEKVATMKIRFISEQDRISTIAFFAGHKDAHELFHQLLAKVTRWGPFELASTKSRVSIVARTRVIWCHEANDDGSIWIGFLLPRLATSSRLRSGPAGGRWSHHLKVSSAKELDAELLGWLREAYDWDVQGIKASRAKAKKKAKRKSTS